MSCPEPPIHVSGVGPFPVQSGGSAIYFPVSLGVASSGLNKILFYVLGHILNSLNIWPQGMYNVKNM